MPVANAAELIRQAYILAQVWDVGEEQPGVQASEGLEVLNLILTEWSSKNTLIPIYTTFTINLVEGDSLITENFLITDVLEAHLVDNALTQTYLYQCNLQEYNRLNFNNISSRPSRFYVEANQSFVQTKTNIYFWPPANGDYTVTMYAKNAMSEVTLVNTMSVFPLNYFKPLLYQMAYDLRDRYMTVLPASFDAQYKELIATLKGVNRKDLSVQVVNEFYETRRLRAYNIYSN